MLQKLTHSTRSRRRRAQGVGYRSLSDSCRVPARDDAMVDHAKEWSHSFVHSSVHGFVRLLRFSIRNSL